MSTCQQSPMPKLHETPHHVQTLKPPSGSLAISVGRGGGGGDANGIGDNGVNTSFDALVALGGGYGGAGDTAEDHPGGSGGSGGGGAAEDSDRHAGGVALQPTAAGWPSIGLMHSITGSDHWVTGLAIGLVR